MTRSQIRDSSVKQCCLRNEILKDQYCSVTYKWYTTTPCPTKWEVAEKLIYFVRGSLYRQLSSYFTSLNSAVLLTFKTSEYLLA